MNKRHERGFTLIELLIVVTILGILLSIAVPSYRDYVGKARRNDAKSALLSTSQAMEKFYTENATYSGTSVGSAATDIAKATSPDSYYTIGFDNSPTAGTACGTIVTTNPSATAYRLCATPTGAQQNDSCGTMSLTHTGYKAPATGCW